MFKLDQIHRVLGPRELSFTREKGNLPCLQTSAVFICCSLKNEYNPRSRFSYPACGSHTMTWKVGSLPKYPLIKTLSVLQECWRRNWLDVVHRTVFFAICESKSWRTQNHVIFFSVSHAALSMKVACIHS